MQRVNLEASPTSQKGETPPALGPALVPVLSVEATFSDASFGPQIPSQC